MLGSFCMQYLSLEYLAELSFGLQNLFAIDLEGGATFSADADQPVRLRNLYAAVPADLLSSSTKVRFRTVLKFNKVSMPACF